MASIAAMCPYLDASFCAEIDALLSDAPDRLDTLQRLVYHLQQRPELQHEYSASLLISMNDTAFAAALGLTHSDQKEELDEYYAMVNSAAFGVAQSTVHCKRCGCEEVEWSVKQTRSADEGSTVFCQCSKCKARWTM